MTSTTSRQRTRLIIGGIFLTLLLAAVFTLGSLDAPFQPRTWRDVITLYAVSSFITALLIVFALVLIRTTLRLLGDQAFCQVLDHPPAGVFDIKSWTFWHHRYGRQVPPLPRRKL